MTPQAVSVRQQAEAARAASRSLARAESGAKNAALGAIAQGLLDRRDEIVAANRDDCRDAEAASEAPAFLQRLRLPPSEIDALAASIRQIAELDDPVGEMIDRRIRPNGLVVERVRVPLGVIASIYESRPNVTVDITALCVKSGNACVLRGGKEAIRCNSLLATICRHALRDAGLPANAVQFIANTDRALVSELLQLRDLIDLMLPRGGADLIRRVRDEATMPVVAGGIGICHTYVDRDVDLDSAVDIVDNAKITKPSACNALDTVLVHRDRAQLFLERLSERWRARGVQWRADREALPILQAAGADVTLAGPDDFDTEFLALIAAVRVVESAEEALVHIAAHGSGHSEAIVTNDDALAERFLRDVDAAAVFANASTRFTDGGEFGLGAEVGISTGKLHARGPMGLRELTSYKWVIRGQGQIRTR